MNLCDLALGHTARVLGLRSVQDVPESVVQRLLLLGFQPGAEVRLLRRAPGGIEPVAVRVGQTVWALRAREARCIELEA